MQDLSANGLPITTIKLGTLKKDVVTNIISETFSTACEVQPLSDVVYKRIFLESFEQSGIVLRMMNEYPKCYIMPRAMNQFFGVKKWLKNHSDEAILKFPLMRDEKKILAMEVMGECTNVASMVGKITDFLLGILLQLRMSFEHGISEETAVALATHAEPLGMFGDEEAAQRCAKLALQIIDLTEGKRLKGLTLFLPMHFVDSWWLPNSDVMEGFKRAHVSAMAAGDVEMGALFWYHSNWHTFISGMQHLLTVQKIMRNNANSTRQLRSCGAPTNQDTAYSFDVCIGGQMP
jgi:predicted ATPase